MKRRVFRLASLSYGPLSQNAHHQFAARHALVHYDSGAVCTFIPKNACSSLRLSLAIANGCIEGAEQYNWIHNNNPTFVAMPRELAQASYTFAFIRCPFERLASAYLDKIVGHTPEAWQLITQLDRALEVNDLTFERFVHLLQRPALRNGNVHWRPQVDFLVYKDYDDYFDVARWSEAAAIIKQRCELDLMDARPLTRHGRDQADVALDLPRPWSISPIELLHARVVSGKLPSVNSLYNDELKGLVEENYVLDIELHNSVSSARK